MENDGNHIRQIDSSTLSTKNTNETQTQVQPQLFRRSYEQQSPPPESAAHTTPQH